MILTIPFVAHAGDAQQTLQWLQSTQRADGSWCHGSYQPSAISYQPSGPSCTSMVQSGIAYLTSQLDAESSLRGDAVLTALYVRIAGQDRPDLLIAPRGIHVDPAVAETGHAAAITAEVKNAGFAASDGNTVLPSGQRDPADAGPFAVSISYQGQPLTAPQAVPGLAAGALTTVTFALPEAPEPGIYNFTAMVDEVDTVDESNERNNTAPFTVKVGTRDLVVSASRMGVVPSRPYPDQTFAVYVTVSNTGGPAGGGAACGSDPGCGLSASGATLALFDGDPLFGGTLIEEKTIPAIAAGGSAIESFSLSGQDPSTSPR